VPEGTAPLDGVANQFRLPTGEIILIQPVIEMASGPDADDHRDLSYDEAAEFGLALDVYDRTAVLTPDD
jgi:hypothetical protein